MVRNLVILGGSSHPELTRLICEDLGIPPGNVLLSKFPVGETRVEINESVRGKDVYILQSGGGKVNDHLMELLILISACKTASAKKVTAMLPLFPYSRQSDIPYNKTGAPLIKASNNYNKPDFANDYTFESTPQTPHTLRPQSNEISVDGLNKSLNRVSLEDSEMSPAQKARLSQYEKDHSRQSDGTEGINGHTNGHTNGRTRGSSGASMTNGVDGNSNGAVGSANGIKGVQQDNTTANQSSQTYKFTPRPGYKEWVAQAGTLVADLLTCAGADHIITMDLHDPQYQGFFDIPVDNLYGRPLLKKYIHQNIPDYKNSVIVSPDAGGAKRATAIADSFGMDFALIHKERRPTRINERQNATMMLVGDVSNRLAILIDDLADTSNTITRAAKLLKKEGASKVYALITHGVLSGEAIERINASALDKVVVTNSVDQRENCRNCPKLEVLEVGHVFAEAIRRVHHGESISTLFQYD